MTILYARPDRGQEYDFVAATTRREQQARLGGWFRDLGLTKQAARVETCCDRVQLALTPEGERKVWPINHCHVRGCVLCGRRRAYRIARAYEPKAAELMAAGHHARLITLTVPNRHELNKAELKQLMAAYNKLRRQSVFKGVKASVASLEVEYSDVSGWHPHIHALTIGNRIGQWDLSNAWAQVSDGEVVDCRAADAGQLSGVLRYINKPFEAQGPEQLSEYHAATAKMQMARAVGAFRGVKANSESKNKAEPGVYVFGVVKADDPIIEDFLAGADVGTPSRAGAAGAGGWVN